VELTLTLAAEMLVLGKATNTLADARARAKRAIESGAALDKFKKMVERQGGDPRVADDPARLPAAPRRESIKAQENGFVQSIHAEKVGLAVVALGGGRAKTQDSIDPSVGLWVRVKPGARVARGDVIFDVAFRDDARFGVARAHLEESLEIGPAPVPAAPLLIERVPGP
jgi:thymidine phosphorylase